ncbi:54S ribosomal protein L11, mitochondrial [Cichlidogyrus casuarinus]|uniref:Large ribosomal subunit protein uL11m n=1 Tax=Cichlidogyrus casuarinus TaxID=1844966 RepID=A0ABD2QL99_9PLAT
MSAKVAKTLKKAVDSNVRHPPFMRITIPAQMAKAAPPLGPQLGKRNINIANFCKDFNERTNGIKPGTPVPCNITLNPDRSYTLVTETPPIWHLVRLAAGCKQGSSKPNEEVSGRISLKHVYEIALVKKQDEYRKSLSLESLCKQILTIANTIGIEVVSPDQLKEDPSIYSPASYQDFLKQRDLFLQQKKAELQEKKQSKMLRL